MKKVVILLFACVICTIWVMAQDGNISVRVEIPAGFTAETWKTYSDSVCFSNGTYARRDSLAAIELAKQKLIQQKKARLQAENLSISYDGAFYRNMSPSDKFLELGLSFGKIVDGEDYHWALFQEGARRIKDEIYLIPKEVKSIIISPNMAFDATKEGRDGRFLGYIYMYKKDGRLFKTLPLFLGN